MKNFKILTHIILLLTFISFISGCSKNTVPANSNQIVHKLTDNETVQASITPKKNIIKNKITNKNNSKKVKSAPVKSHATKTHKPKVPTAKAAPKKRPVKAIANNENATENNFNCSYYKKHQIFNIKEGIDSRYNPKLDSDHDGVACEKKK